MYDPSKSNPFLDPDPIIMQFASQALLSHESPHSSQAASPPSQIPAKSAFDFPSKSRVFILEEWMEIDELGEMGENGPGLDVGNQEEKRSIQKPEFRSDSGSIKTFWLRTFYRYMKRNYIRLRSHMSPEDWTYWKSIAGPKSNFRKDWEKKKDELWTKEGFGKMFKEWFLSEAVDALDKKFGRDSVAGAVYYNHAARHLCDIGTESAEENDAEVEIINLED